jgi:hypothetical protein
MQGSIALQNLLIGVLSRISSMCWTLAAYESKNIFVHRSWNSLLMNNSINKYKKLKNRKYLQNVPNSYNRLIQ